MKITRCTFGLHKFDRVHVDYTGRPEVGANADLIERCNCGEARLLRSSVSVLLFVRPEYTLQDPTSTLGRDHE